MTEKSTLKPSYIVDFSTEELAFLLMSLGIPRLPGIHPSVALDEKMASVVGRSLLARGFAAISGEGVYLIDERLAAVVATGAAFSALLYILCEPNDKAPQKHWFYLSQNLTVLHSKPQPGIERLQTIPDGMSFLLLLTNVMGLKVDSAPVNADSLTVEQVLVEKARDLKQNKGDNAAYQMLVDNIYDEDFALAVVTPVYRIGFSIAKPSKNDIQAGMVLESVQGYWLVNQQGTNLYATRTNTRKILDYIADEMLP
jgi:hypothetical protein